LCAPVLRVETSQVAVLMPAPAVANVPSGFVQANVAPLSTKLTVPVGESSPGAPVTVALNVNGFPKIDGAAPAVRETPIVGAIFETVWLIVGAEAVEKFESPEKVALIVSEPALNAEVVQTAFPPASSGDAQQPEIVFPLEVNRAEPVGAFGANATAESCAVRVTEVPTLDEPELVMSKVGVSFATAWVIVDALLIA
jgi:hypothetical protein